MQLWTFSAVAMTVIAPLPGRNSSVGLRLWPIGGSVCTNLFGNVAGSTKRRRKKKSLDIEGLRKSTIPLRPGQIVCLIGFHGLLV